MFKYIFLAVIAISTLAADIIIKIYEKRKEQQKRKVEDKNYIDIYTITELFSNKEIQRDALEKAFRKWGKLC